MTVHHMAAVMMSQQLLAHGLATHHEVADLARTIKDQQHTEILRMQRWLSSWYGESRHGGGTWPMGPGLGSMMRGTRGMDGSWWGSPGGRWTGEHGRVGHSMMR